MPRVETLEITFELGQVRTVIVDAVVDGGKKTLSPATLSLLEDAIAHQLEPVATICGALSAASPADSRAGRLDFRMLEAEREKLQAVLDLLKAIGIGDAVSSIVELARDLKLQRGVCPDCDKPLTLERGTDPTRDEPGEPDEFYCHDCGCGYPVESVSRETLSIE